jgi:hypothetical protein
VTNPPHPQFQTNLAVIDNHLYSASGSYCYLAMWADEDALALATFKQHISKFERLPIYDALDKSKKSTWEEIEKSNLSVAHLNYVDTFLKVNDKFWFHGTNNWVIFDPDTKKWTAGLPRDRFPMHHPYRTPHFNYYENKIIVPAYNELKLIDKTSGDVTAKVKVDKSDYISAHNHDCHG